MRAVRPPAWPAEAAGPVVPPGAWMQAAWRMERCWAARTRPQATGGRHAPPRRRSASPLALQRAARHARRPPPPARTAGPVCRGLAVPGLGTLERRASPVQVVQEQVRFGQAQVRVVLRLDVGAIRDDVAARLRTQGGGSFEQLHGRRRLAPAQRPDAATIGLVPLLRSRGDANQRRRERQRECAAANPPRANTRPRAVPRQPIRAPIVGSTGSGRSGEPVI